ncbi:hypothetical protein F383_07067 [Gossypium arboreum]|uniref:Uncharacterized protein n=1 Tax=Gossypium arboreum TaxID=29729 RepID=A0A0B0Q020_GOSAR|nr:hypothetical protein F383_07067 [Gossypium arboreum]
MFRSRTKEIRFGLGEN